MVTSSSRRTVLASSLFGGFFGGRPDPTYGASSKGKTNDIIRTVNGMKQRRLGGSDIVVSELGLGTQRWVSSDFNAPDEAACFAFMDKAILENGVNLLDTAEQYPIPSDGNKAREGDTEIVIGKWLRDRKVDRRKVVIATKITGGRNVTPQNVKKDCKCTNIHLSNEPSYIHLTR
jgi:aryl-alcohol dehydrogenase-like predicted oxidoreductase